MSRPAASAETLWVLGVNAVREALESPESTPLELLVARRDARLDPLAAEARRRGVPVRTESREAMTAMTGTPHHQGVALRTEGFAYAELFALLSRPAAEREPLVVLDSIQDPQNLGAILRSACFLGGKGVVIPKDRAAQVTAAAVKVAAGAAAHVPVARVTNLARALDEMKEAGLWVAGLDVTGKTPLYEADLAVPLALVVGNEEKGMRPLVRAGCDLLFRIPALGPVQSLNAATSAAIALSECARQRLARAKPA